MALGSWRLIRQMAAPCNRTRDEIYCASYYIISFLRLLPRDAIMHSAACAVVRCPSVDVRVLHRKSKRVLLKLFLPSGSPAILQCFCTNRYGNTPTGTPKLERRMHVGYEKSAIFDQYLALFRKQHKTGPDLL